MTTIKKSQTSNAAVGTNNLVYESSSLWDLTNEEQTARYITFHMLDKLLKNDIERIFFVKKEIASLGDGKIMPTEQVIYKECLEQYLNNLKD